MENEAAAVQAEEQAKDDRAPLVARRDQLIASYNQHTEEINKVRQQAQELEQRRAQLEVQRLKLEGAIALAGELIGEQPAEASGA